MSPQSMLSRAAEAAYWMSRYMERVEDTARFIDVNLHMTLDLPADIREQWLPLISITGDTGPFIDRYGAATKESVVQFLAFDRENPNSIISCLRAARENARSIREIFSSEMWEQLNRLYLEINEVAATGPTESPYRFLDHVRTRCRLFEGVAEGTMLRDESWHFMRVGRMLERADKTSRILDVKYFILLPSLSDVGTAVDDIQWAAVLKSVSGFEMYRKRFGRISPDSIADFLVLDRQFPRAIQFCMLTATESLHAITGAPAGTFSNLAEQRLGLLCADLNYTHVSEVMAAGLHEFLDSLQRRMNYVDDAIFDTFFALRPVEASVA